MKYEICLLLIYNICYWGHCSGWGISSKGVFYSKIVHRDSIFGGEFSKEQFKGKDRFSMEGETNLPSVFEKLSEIK